MSQKSSVASGASYGPVSLTQTNFSSETGGIGYQNKPGVLNRLPSTIKLTVCKFIFSRGEPCMELSIQSDEGNTVRLDLTGRITQSEVMGVSDLLVELLGPEVYSCNVLLDMSHTEFVDSSGVSWL